MLIKLTPFLLGIPFSKGSFCSSLFLETLNREEFCLLSFFTCGGPENFILEIWAGGGCVSALGADAFFFAWKNKTRALIYACRKHHERHSSWNINKRKIAFQNQDYQPRPPYLMTIWLPSYVGFEREFVRTYLIFRILCAFFRVCFRTTRCLSNSLKIENMECVIITYKQCDFLRSGVTMLMLFQHVKRGISTNIRNYSLVNKPISILIIRFFTKELTFSFLGLFGMSKEKISPQEERFPFQQCTDRFNTKQAIWLVKCSHMELQVLPAVMWLQSLHAVTTLIIF